MKQQSTKIISKKTLHKILYFLFILFIFFIFSEKLYCKNKIIHVRSDHNYPPYEFLNKGEPDGFNIDLIKAVAEVMNFEVEIKLGPWTEVREELKAGKIDMIAGMYFSGERNKTFDFSVPNLMVSSGLFVRNDSDIKSFKDIKNKEIIVQKDDIMHDLLKKDGITDNIIQVEDVPDALKLLAAGKHDCLLLSSEVQGLYFINKFKIKNIKVLKTGIEPRSYCFAVSEGNRDLLYRLNEGLNILKTNGKYEKIYEKWFGLYEKKKNWRSLKYYIIIILIILLLLLISILWLWSLKKLVAKKTAELNFSEKRLTMALDASNEGFADWNFKENKVYFSPRYYTILDYKPYEFPQSYEAWENLTNPDDLKKVKAIVKEYVEDKRDSHEVEFRMKSKKGNWKWILSRGKAMERNRAGKIERLVLTHSDITSRKIMEEELYRSNISLEDALKKLRETQQKMVQQERLKAIGQMASGIAHDINNALTPVLGHCNLLVESKNLSDKEKNSLNIIIMACKDISSTVARLKDFYRFHSKEERFESIVLNTIIPEVIELTKPRWKNIARKSGILIDIKTEFENNLPAIMGIKSDIRESLTNLLFNSLDAMGDGGIITFKTSSGENKVVLEVADTGTGMDENIKNHCFEPFFTTKGERGTGLGLSMVYGIIERHRGKIEITSFPGKGTTAKLTFPVYSIKEKKKILDETAKIPSLKILCIDDEEQVLEILKLIIKRGKHSIKTAESGKEGVKIFKEEKEKESPFDIVITDLGMPHMDGYEVIHNIKSLSPHTPVIIMTGWGAYLEDENIQNADFLLPKPFTIKDLNRALKKCLRIGAS